ncbi:hypothetical protein FACS189442_1930 [Spirochaetia bacterium]|nr:hypothetical protein FACS189442_1820 [Spirochaetia bacterium]GHU54965.1 hypothetical protein FACS189442_1930 [Spirochaetia bacterium]
MVDSSRLSKYSLFGGLLTEQIDEILPLMKYETYAAGEDIITEGEPNDRIRFIISGRAEVFKNALVLAECQTGDIVGEMEVLDMLPSAATVRAISPVEIASLSNTTLPEIYTSPNGTGGPVRRIGDGSFTAMSLTTVIIPNGITHIGADAFSGNSITSVIIPDSIISIGNGAFDNDFTAYYNSREDGKRAGTYTYDGSAWTLAGAD